jgi:hypothetical protein
MLLPDVLGGARGLGGGDETFMIALFAKTWFLWWLLSSVVILRWFHAVAVVDPSEHHSRSVALSSLAGLSALALRSDDQFGS